ncbi:hypothetical protein MHU86_10762 [Fragilaria crotonensis]|nr:hypothetical protein MHU86_10762 [Fragilaria crotonensis]
MKLVTAALIVLLFPLVDAGSKTGRSSRRVKYVLDTKEGEGNGAEQVSPYFNRLDTGTLPRRMKVDSSGDCFVDVSLTCTPKNNETESCDHLFSSAKTASCESPPSEVEFGFLGGNCPNSTRLEGDAKFICRDFNGGPVTHSGEGKEAYIVASSPRMIGNEYFAGTVPYNSIFPLVNAGGGALLDETMVLVYEDASMEKLLQLMIFKTSCENSFTLGDDFGSIELVSFTNSVQNKVSAKVTAMYEITITNKAQVEATLMDVVALSDDTNHDLWKSLKGEVIAPGKEISIVEEMTVDLWTSEGEHFMTAFVSAKIPGRQCSSVGQMDISWDVSD